MILGKKTRMTNNISFSELKKAYLQSANIVAIYGERYLPIFERLEKEYKNSKPYQLKGILISSPIDRDTAVLLDNLDIENNKDYCIQLMSIPEYQLC